MATLVLGATGAAVGASAFGTVGAGALFATNLTAGLFAAGGLYLDQAFLFPAILPGPPDQEGPRLEEVSARFASEGAPINRMFGSNNKTGGTFIWVDDIEEVENVEEVESGKFDQITQEITTFSYFISMAVALGKGPMTNVTRIWANGKLIYKKASDTITLTSSNFSVTANAGFGGFLPGVMRVSSPAGSPDLSSLAPGTLTTTSGFTNGGNNITGISLFGGTDGAGGTFIDIANPLAVTEAAGASATVQQLQINFFEFTVNALTDLTFYPGDETQNPDPLIGGGGTSFQTPAYRGTAYVVLERLALEEFGNNVPTLQFEVEEANIRTFGEAIGTLLEEAGLTSSEYDVGGLNDVLRGYVIPGPQSTVRAIRPLLRANNIVVREVNGVLSFIKRGTERVIAVTAADLGARSGGGDVPQLISIKDVSDDSLPDEVNVQYIDVQEKEERGSQRERRINNTTPATMTLDLPITMTANEARAVASRELWTAWTNRQEVHFTLPPSYYLLDEQDVVTFNTGGVNYRIVITSIDRGHNFVLSCKGLIEPSETFEYPDAPGEPADNGPDDVIQAPPFLALAFMDFAPLASLHVEVVGAYFGVAPPDPNAIFSSAAIWMSTQGDVEADYQFLAAIPNKSQMGVADTVLASGPHGYWDNVNTVDVTVWSGTLVNRTAMDVLEGFNLAVIGNEMIGFQTATLLSTGKYRLSNLLRELGDTVSSGHAVNDRFVPLSPGQLAFIALDQSLIGRTIHLKAVHAGGALANATAHQFTYNGGTVRPFRVANMESIRGPSDDEIVTTWEYKTTHPGYRMFGDQEIPEPLNGERYDVEYRDASDVLLRTVSNITVRTDTYTEAEQTTDGITPGDTVKVEVFQRGTLVGRGTGVQITVT